MRSALKLPGARGASVPPYSIRLAHPSHRPLVRLSPAFAGAGRARAKAGAHQGPRAGPTRIDSFGSGRPGKSPEPRRRDIVEPFCLEGYSPALPAEIEALARLT
jgi:hypothetical protein